jgi:hypothetical protein
MNLDDVQVCLASNIFCLDVEIESFVIWTWYATLNFE